MLAGGDRARRAHGWHNFFATPLHPGGYRMAPDRRLLIPLTPYATKDAVPKNWGGLLTSSGGRLYSDASKIGGETGDFQEAVYGGPPSMYAEPGKSSNGDGSLGNPYQYSQLAANVSPGDIVGIVPGFEERAGEGADDQPAFDPGVNGGSSTRIAYVGQYDPGTMGNPLTDGNRSQYGHSGGHTEGTGGCPTYGWAAGRDYVTFDSLVANSSDGPFVQDGGALCCIEALAPIMRRMYIRADVGQDPSESNYVALWVTDCTDLEVSDCTITGVYHITEDNTNTCAITLYGAKNYSIFNNDILDSNQAFYSKGEVNGKNYGSFFRNRIVGGDMFARMQATSDTERSRIYQNLITGLTRDGITFGDASGNANISIYNNTVVLASSNFSWLHDADAAKTVTALEHFENIIVLEGSGSSVFVGFGGSSTTAWSRFRNNLYYRASGTQRFNWNGSSYNSVANFQTALTSGGMGANAREESSQHANPLLDGNFEPGVGSPALTMGTASGLGGAGGRIGHTAGSPTIGRRS